MAKAKEVKADTLTEVPVSKIIAQDDWNCRSGRSDASNDEASEQSELIESIREVGQETPCFVTPGPDGTFFLKTGFRRYYAIKTLAEEAKKDLPVRVIVRIMNAKEAAEMNARENIARQDLNAPDTCFAVGRARDAGRDDGSYENESKLAHSLGLKQPWVMRLMRCYDGLHPDVFNHWRKEALIKLPVATMFDLAGTPRDEQYALYTKLYKARERQSKTRAPGAQKSPVERACAKAKKLGETLGTVDAIMQEGGHSERVYDWDGICERMVYPDFLEGDDATASNRRKVWEEMSSGHARAFRDYPAVLAEEREAAKAEAAEAKAKANRKVAAVAQA